MSKVLTLAEHNMVTVMLMQSLLGAISQNFRMVSLLLVGKSLKLQFVLETESSEDREEIADVSAEFDGLLFALSRDDLGLETEILVERGVIDFPPHPGRVVFRRKE